MNNRSRIIERVNERNQLTDSQREEIKAAFQDSKYHFFVLKLPTLTWVRIPGNALALEVWVAQYAQFTFEAAHIGPHQWAVRVNAWDV